VLNRLNSLFITAPQLQVATDEMAQSTGWSVYQPACLITKESRES